MTISNFNNQIQSPIFVTMILVTGATGLVGAHLLLHLLENEEVAVRAIYRNQKHLKKTKALFDLYHKDHLFSKVEWTQADITDIPSLEIAFKDIDYVYHCAACISFDPNDEELLRKVNIEGTANIVNFCIDKNIKKLCHVSSVAALGDLIQKVPNTSDESTEQTLITEETDWNPEVLHSDYAISKYGGEMEVWRGHQEGLQVVIVNPGVILGPGFWNQGSGMLFNSVKKGFPFFTKGLTGYVAVTDVVKIMCQLMKSDCNGERFTLISENITYQDIIYKIAGKIRASRPKIEAKPWILNLAWRLDWLFSSIIRTKRIISKASAQSLLYEDLLSNEKIKKQLNYSFEGIDNYLDKIVVYYKK